MNHLFFFAFPQASEEAVAPAAAETSAPDPRLWQAWGVGKYHPTTLWLCQNSY